MNVSMGTKPLNAEELRQALMAVTLASALAAISINAAPADLEYIESAARYLQDKLKQVKP